MMMLTKFVVVTKSGNWLSMESGLNEAREIAARNQGTYVERWTYPVNPDGSHGAPWKRRMVLVGIEDESVGMNEAPDGEGKKTMVTNWNVSVTVINTGFGGGTDYYRVSRSGLPGLFVEGDVWRCGRREKVKRILPGPFMEEWERLCLSLSAAGAPSGHRIVQRDKTGDRWYKLTVE